MARRLRFIPKVVPGRGDLSNDYRVDFSEANQELRSLVLGVLGRSLRLYPVRLHAFVFLSNHYHMLLERRRCSSTRSVHELSQLERGPRGRDDSTDGGRRFWGRRYQAIVISEEETGAGGSTAVPTLSGLQGGSGCSAAGLARGSKRRGSGRRGAARRSVVRSHPGIRSAYARREVSPLEVRHDGNDQARSLALLAAPFNERIRRRRQRGHPTNRGRDCRSAYP